MELTPVVFRVWKAEPRTVLALFPSIPFDLYGVLCQCYEHVGQHGGADYNVCIARTRPATPEEYASLKRELESVPYEYVLQVYQRKPKG